MYKRILQYALAAVLCVGALGGGYLAADVANASTITLYKCFQNKGLVWTSVQARAESGIPAQYGVWKYSGTTAQNTLLAGRMCGTESTDEHLLGAGFSVATGYEKNLRVPMTSVQDYVPVTSFLLKDGTTLSISDLGNKVFLTLEPGTVREEITMCTTQDLSGIDWETCTRGLAFSGTSTTAVAANAKTHPAGSKVVMSNVHYVYEEKLNVKDNELSFGDATSSTDKYIYFNDGTATPPAIKWETSSNQLKFRRANGDAYRVMPTQLRGTYADYASLPTSTNSAGDIAITEDDDKMYVWDATGSTWVLAGGSSGAGTVYKTNKLGSESDGGDLKTFSLSAGSWPSSNFLLVYKNGISQREGASYDYTIIDSNTIEFTTTLSSDDTVQMFVVSVDLYNPAWGVVNASILPDTDNAYDIGSSSLQFKDVYATGTVYVKNLSVNGVLATSTATANAPVLADSSGLISNNWLRVMTKVSVTSTENTIASTTVKTFLSETVPANYLLSGNVLKIEAFIKNLSFQANKIVTINLNYGGSVIATTTVTCDGSTREDFTGKLDMIVYATSNTTQKTQVLLRTTMDTGVDVSFGGVANYTNTYTSAVDATSAQTLTITGYFNSNDTAVNELTISDINAYLIR